MVVFPTLLAEGVGRGNGDAPRPVFREFNATVNVLDGTATGSFTFTAANGDQLFCHIHGLGVGEPHGQHHGNADDHRRRRTFRWRQRHARRSTDARPDDRRVHGHGRRLDYHAALNEGACRMTRCGAAGAPWMRCSSDGVRHTICSHLRMRGAPAVSSRKPAGQQDLATTQRHKHLSSVAIEGALRLLDQPKASVVRGDIILETTGGEISKSL